MPRPHRVFLFALLLVASAALADEKPQAGAPGGQPAVGGGQPAVGGGQPAGGEKVGRLPHVSFDVKKRQVRVECEALAVDAPLEFFCVVSGTSEHESVLRTPAKPSHIQFALLAIGLKPGRPVQFSESQKKWLPPQGPPLHVSVEFAGKDGRPVTVPAYRCMRDQNTKKEMKPMNWVYAGSRVMDDGVFAADVTGYVISVVNFDLTLIDIPTVASNSNELLEWERNPDVAPPGNTKVTMVIEPAGDKAAADGAADKAREPRSETATGAADAVTGASDMSVDEQRMKELRDRWSAAVRPHASALREAAQAHYDVIAQMRQEQQRLIDEADRIQRAIDALEKEYQDFTTPRPPPAPPAAASSPAPEQPSAPAAAGQ